MQWIGLQEVVVEFSLDVDLCRCCEVLMGTVHWKETSCHISYAILDVEGLQAAKVGLWAPPAKDEEWVNPHNRQILPL